MFEWDEAKNQANIGKHGVSFTTAIQIFQGPVLSVIEDRGDYDEGSAGQYRTDRRRAHHCRRPHRSRRGNPHHFRAPRQAQRTGPL
ncbi:BrnT family toxin [Aurantimonas sp. A2-1-M11]|uniref:BrnT family toxin n=1 Tax=Aurantimonas sp. A2-1-M11 TaxID=3113712 RepID=UPI002F940C6A